MFDGIADPKSDQSNHFYNQSLVSYVADGEYMFADPESKLSKYGPKSWRSSHTHVNIY